MLGKYIAFEGIDGCGKTTQSKMLGGRLAEKGIHVVMTMEPGSHLNGFNVRELLLSHKNIDPIALEMLFEADRAEHTARVEKILAQGKWIISDRCYLSGLAYGMSCGHRPEFLHDLLECSVRVKPDIAFILQVPPSAVAHRLTSRGESTREEAKGLAFAEKVAQHYSSFPETLPDFLKCPVFHFDGLARIGDIADGIWKNMAELGV